MYNLIEYSDNYWKTSGGLRQSPPNNPFTDSKSFKFKLTFASNTSNQGTKDVQIAVAIKYLSNFCRTREIPLINCEITLTNFVSKLCYF